MGVSLITGCSSGIGMESALALARRGNTVVATMRNLSRATDLNSRAEAEGLTVEVRELDVTVDESVAVTVAAILADHGTIDILVNNAGVANRGPVESQSLDSARALMDTNFWGPIRLARAVLPAMREQRSGTIVNVSSLAGRLPGTPYSGMYAASKHALGTISEALAGEVSPFGIRVVSIEPGFFATSIADNNLSTDEVSDPVYAADAEWVASFFESSVADGGDPARVATAIVAAIEDDSTALHTPVGDDAAMFLAVLDGVDDYEGWQATVIPIIEAAVGPRPTP
jgi:NAD(P)-dependent dehydrogenase (short-subunit alcohol dehydrogenase family)